MVLRAIVLIEDEAGPVSLFFFSLGSDIDMQRYIAYILMELVLRFVSSLDRA